MLAILKLPGYICLWKVVNMEAVVLDVVGRVLGRVDHHVLRRRVQHMAHPNVFQVGDVADRLPIADYDPVENLWYQSLNPGFPRTELAPNNNKKELLKVKVLKMNEPCHNPPGEKASHQNLWQIWNLKVHQYNSSNEFVSKDMIN